MVGWHHWLNGHGFRWTPGVGDGQGGLACCGSQSCKESDTTEWLNWTELKILFSKRMVIQSQYLIVLELILNTVLFVWHVDKKCKWLSVFVSTLKQNFQSFFKSPNHLNGSTSWDCKTRLETKCWYHL